MPRTKSTSSSRRASRSRETRRLVRVLLERLLPHPANPNVMSDDLLEKLAANITLEGDYEPLTVRPHPDDGGYFQILGGHQRRKVVELLGYTHALCYLWPCDDETALRLLVTLNRPPGRRMRATSAMVASLFGAYCSASSLIAPSAVPASMPVSAYEPTTKQACSPSPTSAARTVACSVANRDASTPIRCA